MLSVEKREQALYTKGGRKAQKGKKELMMNHVNEALPNTNEALTL